MLANSKVLVFGPWTRPWSLS